MANTVPTIDLTSLDPDTLMSSFVTFMQSQDVFKDYNYDGAAMRAILRILSHNSYLNAFFLNMLASEAIGIDTAQTRSALISHAKELNYTPRSTQSAVANVTVTFSGTDPSYIIQKGESFSTTVKNKSFNFSIPENILVTSANSFFTFTTPIYEGTYQTDNFIMNYNDETQRFVLTNNTVDTRSISVVVFEDGSSQGTPYTEATTLLGVNETNKIYFVQASETESYEVVFGDNVLGRRPKDGSIVVIDYRIASGSVANGARTFTPNFSPANTSLLTGTATALKVVTNADSADGEEAESEESIRYKAPRHFQVQERAASAPDFAILLQEQFPEITAVSAYGGEEVNPPRYGRVYIAINIQGVDGLPDSKITEYTKFLQNKCMLTKTPVFVEPEYTYVQINSVVTYNINVTRLTTQNIQALVINQIMAFDTTYLSDFSGVLRYSKLVRQIDDSDPSILGNETDLKVYKKLNPIVGSPQNLDINFDMPLDQGNQEVNSIHPFMDQHTIWSTPFLFNGDLVWLDDDGIGNVYIKRRIGQTAEFVKKIGTVDYTTGLIQLSSFQIDSFDGTYFKVYVRAAEKDIMSDKATILGIESDEITITVKDVRI